MPTIYEAVCSRHLPRSPHILATLETLPRQSLMDALSTASSHGSLCLSGLDLSRDSDQRGSGSLWQVRSLELLLDVMQTVVTIILLPYVPHASLVDLVVTDTLADFSVPRL